MPTTIAVSPLEVLDFGANSKLEMELWIQGIEGIIQLYNDTQLGIVKEKKTRVDTKIAVDDKDKLLKASQDGNAKFVKILLESGVNSAVQTKDRTQRGPLHLCCMQARVVVVSAICEYLHTRTHTRGCWGMHAWSCCLLSRCH